MRLTLDPDSLYFFIFAICHIDTHSFLYSTTRHLLGVFWMPDLVLDPGDTRVTKTLGAS